jgi:hypothetical protein
MASCLTGVGAINRTPALAAKPNFGMKFFIDTAGLPEIRSLAGGGMTNSVTTNPSRTAKSVGKPRPILPDKGLMVVGPGSEAGGEPLCGLSLCCNHLRDHGRNRNS